MICPKCSHDRCIVRDNCYNYINGEHYRRRQCAACKHSFYTIEYEVEYDEQFQINWNRWDPPEDVRLQSSRSRFRAYRQTKKLSNKLNNKTQKEN